MFGEFLEREKKTCNRIKLQSSLHQQYRQEKMISQAVRLNRQNYIFKQDIEIVEEMHQEVINYLNFGCNNDMALIRTKLKQGSIFRQFLCLFMNICLKFNQTHQTVVCLVKS